MGRKSAQNTTTKAQIYWDLITKAIGASLLIGIGDYVLLLLGNPIGPFLFAIGLLGVCVMKLNLFTGKCGFWLEDKIPFLHLFIILIVNLAAGWGIGYLFSFANAEIVTAAVTKVASWDVSWSFFIRSVMCGAIMYIAVLLYRKGTNFGILLGIPTFIFCGFQHCIANAITLGVAHGWSWTLPICVLGNLVGSLSMWDLSRNRV